jgi:hypothetical protein
VQDLLLRYPKKFSIAVYSRPSTMVLAKVNFAVTEHSLRNYEF